MLQTKIPPPAYALAAAALMWWLNRQFPIWRWLEAPGTHAGWAVVALGLMVDAYSVVGFLRARTTVNPMRITATRELVTTGLYRWSRNPMYFGLIVGLTGWGIALGSLTPFIAILLFQRLMVTMQIAPEEAALEAKFGDVYRAYKRRVHRWVGRNGSA